MNIFLVDFENVKLDGIKDLRGVCQGDTLIIFYSENCKNVTIDLLESITQMKLQFKSFKVKGGTKNALDFQLSSYLGFLIGRNEKQADSRYYIVSKDKGYDCVCDYWKGQKLFVERITLQEPVKPAKVPAAASAQLATPQFATAQPTTAQQTTTQQTTTQPTTVQPTTVQPTTPQPATAQPIVSQPLTTTPAAQKQPKKSKSKVGTGDLVSLEEIKRCLSEEDMPDIVLEIFNQYKSKQAICNGISKMCKDSKRTSAIYKKLKPLFKEKKKS